MPEIDNSVTMASTDGDTMMVLKSVEVDRNEMPVLVERDVSIEVRRRLFAYIDAQLRGVHFAHFGPGFVPAMRGTLRISCIVDQFGDLAWLSVPIPDDFDPPAPWELRKEMPLSIGSVDPSAFSCRWDPVTAELIADASHN